ncbi:DUF3618 domain-containing protein [Micromonospora psammae]|uniref:DUF3618 domain-containing protein n=1 Tax=Micromonospora sp. CPCC 205556 TaxID=3122398 RepID=UPI002FF1C304
MSNDPDRIRQNIEMTRAELSSDVDALAHRASPRRIASAQATRARGRLSRAVDSVMGTARHTRAGATRRGSAAGQHVSDVAHHGAEAASGAAHQASDTASAVGQRAHEFTDATRERAHELTDATRERAHELTDATRERAHELTEATRERAHALTEATRERAQGNPLAAGLIAFGVGLLAASLVPPSRNEHDLAERAKQKVMEHSGQVKQGAGAMMHQVQENLREPAQQASEAVRSTAAQGVAAVRDTGRDQATHVRDDARDAPRRM